MNCRIVDIFNWEAMPSVAIAALASVLEQQPSCLIDAASDMAATVAAPAVTLTWSAGAGPVTATYVDVSTRADTFPSGELVDPDVVSHGIATGETFTFNWPHTHDGNTTLFAVVVVEGCASDGFLQRAVSALLQLDAPQFNSLTK
jgi:hypothetical protein